MGETSLRDNVVDTLRKNWLEIRGSIFILVRETLGSTEKGIGRECTIYIILWVVLWFD